VSAGTDLDSRRSAFRELLRQCFPNRNAVAVALFVCVLAPAALVALQIHDNPKLSPIDEAAHWDYVKRVAGGSVPRIGQQLEPSTLREVVCRGTDLNGLDLPACSARHISPQRFPGNAAQYEAQQPPTYYAATVPLRWFGKDVLGMADVTATRAAGILWLTVGLLVLWSAARIVELDVPVIGAGILLLATAPVVIYHTAVISNDVPSILGGSLVALLGALAWKRPGRWTVPVLGLAAFLLVAIKTTELFPVTIVAALLLIRAGAEMPSWDRQTWSANLKPVALRWWRDGGVLLAGGIAAAVIWIVLNRSLALIDPKTLGTFAVLRTHGVSSALILREAIYLLGPTTDSYVSTGTLNQNLQVVLADLLRFLLLAGALAGLFVSPRRWFHWLGLLIVPILLAGGFLFGLGLRINYSIDPSLSARYALPVAPLLILTLIAAVRGRWVVRGLWAFGLASFVLTLSFMV
jgi:hypothetical protein